MLDRLSPAFGQLTFTQGRQGLNVGKYPSRLVEGPDQVLGLGQIDCDFSADRCVHHGRHAGGNLDEGDAPQESGRHEARQVAHNAATHRDDGMASLSAAFH